MNKRFTATDAGGNTYSLEYYSYDYQTIYDSAQRISGGDLLRSGPDGTRKICSYRIDNSNGKIRYIKNKLFVLTGYWSADMLLHTLDGSVIDLSAAFSERINIYYRENDKKRLQDSHLVLDDTRLFGDTLCVEVRYHNRDYKASVNEYALIDISGSEPSVYILDDVNNIEFIWSAWDFVIYSGKAYLFTNSGEAVVFNIDDHTLRYERTVPFWEIHISGWRGGEWIFVSDETITAYNLSTRAVRPLGMEVKNKEYYPGYYFYEDTNGRRFVVGSNSGKTFPMLDVELDGISIFERGYMYREKDNRHINICFFEDGALKRKIVLSGSALGGAFIYGNTLYMGMRHLAFTVDLTSMQIGKSFSSEKIHYNSGYRLNMFPFGADDIVYGEVYDDGDR
jgi:hypothetical protein